jgi:hypothetical protein
MAISSLFKKPPPASDAPAPLGPNESALASHVAKMSAINQQRQSLCERAGQLAGDIDAAAKCAAEIDALRIVIDAKAVAAVVNTTPVDLSPDRERLDLLLRKLALLTERAGVAQRARDELQAKSESLLKEYRAMQPALNALLVNALIEQMQSLAPALAEAEGAYRKVHRAVFTRAVAIEQISTSHKLGVVVDALRFTQNIPQLPRLAPFDTLCPNRFEVNVDYNTKLQTEAQELIGTMLRGC